MENTKTTESSILIAHLGDNHLRDSQYANSERSLDFCRAFGRAVRAAWPADVIVNAGDIFDSSRPTAKVIGQLIQIDEVLRSHGKTMLCITGNHDRSSPSWLSTLFQRAEGPGIIPMDGRTIEVGGFVFAGIEPYTARQFRSNKAAICALTANADVVMYHGFVDGVVPMYCSDKNVLTVDDMPKGSSVKAVLLADIHKQGFVTVKGEAGQDVLIGYPGTTEMCSESESTEKSLPMIRLTKERAVVEEYIPLEIRPFLTDKIRTEEQLDAFMQRVEAIADQNPVVSLEFERELTQTITRIYGALDPQKALIRCYPLGIDKEVYARPEMFVSEGGDKTLGDFMTEAFEDDEELQALALALVIQGPDDADNIVSQFVEKNTVSL